VAREHARIWLDINSDDDFEALPFDAQGFYTRVILTLDDLSYCGVATWRPRKLTTKAPDLTYERILTAAAALEIGRYCLFDLDTEEVLARSYIRRDLLLRNPKYAAAVLRTYGGIASKVLRAAVVTEVRRVREEHPEYSSWTAKDKTTDIGAELSKLMVKPGLDEVPYTNRIAVPITNGQTVEIGNADQVEIGNAEPVQITNPVGNAESVPIPLTLTLTPTPSPLEGYVTGERHQSAEHDPNSPPTPHCPRHPGGTNLPCQACRAAREHRDAWDEARARAAAERRAEFAAEVRACPDCDQTGWIDHGNQVARCPNHDWEHLSAKAEPNAKT
jgi:hypothetical protein